MQRSINYRKVGRSFLLEDGGAVGGGGGWRGSWRIRKRTTREMVYRALARELLCSLMDQVDLILS